MYSYKYNEILGIDLKQDSIHVVHCARKVAGFKILKQAWARLPENEAEKHKVIKAFLLANRWEGMPCVVSSYHNSSLLRTIEIQDSSSKAITFGLERLAKEFAMVSKDLSLIDYQVVKLNKRKLLVAIAGRELNINSFLTFLEELDLEVIDIVHPSIGILSGLEAAVPHDEFLLTVNTAIFGTDIIMGKSACPLYFYHSSISSSGYSRENMENPIEDSTVVFPKQLSLIETGRFSKSGLNLIWQSEVNASIGKAVNFSSKHDIVLNSISLTLENPAPAFTSALAEKTGLEVNNIDLKKFELDTQFLTALGLATIALQEKIHISLLPESRRQKRILKFQQKAFFMVPLLLLLTEALIAYILQTGVTELELRKNGLKKQVSEETALALEISKLRQENIMYRIQAKPFKNAIINNHSLLKVLEAVSKAKSADDWVTVIADKNKYSASIKNSDAAESKINTEKFSSFVVEGYTLKDDLSSVKEMIAKLKDSDYIYNADLMGDNIRRNYTPVNLWTNQEYKAFAVELELLKHEH
ncbi:MAG: hypothetical protein PF692_14870 [Kiritimatiellae bacterium]|jgi:hypothetical protein|nr:hypothetical protein [Kiritimatiellia bacterium]